MFPAEPVPDTIGSYKIIRRLSAAGTAEVYLARSQGPMGFARECELKLMSDTSDGNRDFAEELAREAAISGRLNNPAVVRVFDFFTHQGKLVLALEHVEGYSLADVVQHVAEKRQKLGETAIYHIGARIAGALADAHAATDEQGNPTPIVHRNLSPETVLISVEGEVRLTGFGVGKILGRTPDTAIGRIKGTPGYMAPEQARGEPITTKADVYGLGLLLWSLLAAERPPTDGTWPRRISGVRTDLPREVAALVDAALDPFPGTRKISAREMDQWLSKAAPAAKGKAELREKVASMRTDPGAKDAEPPPPSSRRRIATSGSPYQGVRFGPPPPPRGAAGAAGARKPSPSIPADALQAERTPAPSVVGKVALHLPPPPPEELSFASVVVPTPRQPPPADPAPIRFGPPPADLTPLPPAVAPISAPMPAGPTRPSRALTASHPGAPQDPTADPAPISAIPISAIPVSAVPVSAAPIPKPPAQPVLAPPALTPPPARGLAPSLALAPSPGPPPVEPSSVSIRFGAPPPAATPAPAPVTFGRPPAAMSLPVPRPPLPSLLTIGPGRRSLSAMGAIVVSAITATVVVSVAIYFFVVRDKASSRSPGASSAAVAVTASPASAAVPAPSPSPASTGAPNPAELPFGYGYLTVVSPAAANVFMSGKLAGPVNKPLRVRCGRWFIRLATTQEGRYPDWVTAGETVLVACQESTRIDMNPRRP